MKYDFIYALWICTPPWSVRLVRSVHYWVVKCHNHKNSGNDDIFHLYKLYTYRSRKHKHMKIQLRKCKIYIKYNPQLWNIGTDQSTNMWRYPPMTTHILSVLTPPPPPPPLVPPICVGKLGQRWFRWWLVAYLVPSHYLNQCLFIVN